MADLDPSVPCPVESLWLWGSGECWAMALYALCVCVLPLTVLNKRESVFARLRAWVTGGLLHLIGRLPRRVQELLFRGIVSTDAGGQASKGRVMDAASVAAYFRKKYKEAHKEWSLWTGLRSVVLVWANVVMGKFVAGGTRAREVRGE